MRVYVEGGKVRSDTGHGEVAWVWEGYLVHGRGLGRCVDAIITVYFWYGQYVYMVE